MKRILISLLIGVFAFSVAYSATKGPVKAVKMQKLDKTRMMEKEPSLEAVTNDLAADKIDIIVTAPINKKNIQSNQFSFPKLLHELPA